MDSKKNKDQLTKIVISHKLNGSSNRGGEMHVIRYHNKEEGINGKAVGGAITPKRIKSNGEVNPNYFNVDGTYILAQEYDKLMHMSINIDSVENRYWEKKYAKDIKEMEKRYADKVAELSSEIAEKSSKSKSKISMPIVKSRVASPKTPVKFDKLLKAGLAIGGIFALFGNGILALSKVDLPEFKGSNHSITVNGNFGWDQKGGNKPFFDKDGNKIIITDGNGIVIGGTSDKTVDDSKIAPLDRIEKLIQTEKVSVDKLLERNGILIENCQSASSKTREEAINAGIETEVLDEETTEKDTALRFKTEREFGKRFDTIKTKISEYRDSSIFDKVKLLEELKVLDLDIGNSNIELAEEVITIQKEFIRVSGEHDKGVVSEYVSNEHVAERSIAQDMIDALKKDVYSANSENLTPSANDTSKKQDNQKDVR